MTGSSTTTANAVSPNDTNLEKISNLLELLIGAQNNAHDALEPKLDKILGLLQNERTEQPRDSQNPRPNNPALFQKSSFAHLPSQNLNNALIKKHKWLFYLTELHHDLTSYKCLQEIDDLVILRCINFWASVPGKNGMDEAHNQALCYAVTKCQFFETGPQSLLKYLASYIDRDFGEGIITTGTEIDLISLSHVSSMNLRRSENVGSSEDY